jgi:predicted kinase
VTGPRRVILMSGYPASGKTTLAHALAERFGFALVAKDALLDVMYEAAGGKPGDPELSLRTGRAAWAAFWHLSRTCPQVVLDSNIQPDGAIEAAEIARIAGPIVEVHCRCPLELARRRYAERAKLHRPAQRATTLDDARGALYGRPLGLPWLVVVDTSQSVDLDEVSGRIFRAFENADDWAAAACTPPGTRI